MPGIFMYISASLPEAFLVLGCVMFRLYAASFCIFLPYREFCASCIFSL
jgi:hypothetical protein